MIKITRTYYCDACEREINGYRATISVVEKDQDDCLVNGAYMFCEDCMKSFRAWKESRKEKHEEQIDHSESEYLHRLFMED